MFGEGTLGGARCLAVALAISVVVPAVAADGPLGGAARHQAAVTLFDHIRKIDGEVPTLTPDQTERVVGEQRAAVESRDMRRFFALAESRDYSVWVVQANIRPLLVALGHLVDRQYANPQSEVELWAVVARHLAEGSLYSGLAKLGELKLVEPPVQVDGAPPEVAFHGIREEIFTGILVPYLEGRLPD